MPLPPPGQPPPFPPPGPGWPSPDPAAAPLWDPGLGRGRHASADQFTSPDQFHQPDEFSEPDDLDDDLDDDLLRPFVVTRGRSRPQVAGLRVETQLRARPEAAGRPLRFEAQRIVAACRTPRSLAEIAVVLGMPLGVVRILIADLIADRLLVHEEPGQISIAMLERIRDRVRAL